MALSTFGVVHGDIKASKFPSLADFSSTTKPTSTTVGSFVNRAAADLVGGLAIKGVTAADIDSSGEPAAYAWCQNYVIIGAAIMVVEAQAGAGAVPEWWTKELESLRTSLEEYGYLALGDAPAPSQSVDGPRSHGLEHGLDTGDVDDISDLIPKFRRNDVL